MNPEANPSSESKNASSSTNYAELFAQTNEQDEQSETQSSAFAAKLELIEQQTARLEAQAEDLAEEKMLPYWWGEIRTLTVEVKKKLADPDVDAVNISDYFTLRQAQRQVEANIRGFETGLSSVAALVTELGDEIFARGFMAEPADGPMHEAMLDAMSANVNDHVVVSTELDVLSKIYATESRTELLSVHGDAYADKLRPLLRNENSLKWMRYQDQTKAVDFSSAETQANSREWMTTALSMATGLESSEAAGYVFAASRQGEDKSLVDILDRFESFGADRLRTIAAVSGIRAFETYTPEQLTRMERLAVTSERIANELSSHDVNVVMINRVGDHNGVLESTADIYEDGAGRTLFFGIDRMGDIYRHMTKLHDLGIRP